MNLTKLIHVTPARSSFAQVLHHFLHFAILWLHHLESSFFYWGNSSLDSPWPQEATDHLDEMESHVKYIQGELKMKYSFPPIWFSKIPRKRESRKWESQQTHDSLLAPKSQQKSNNQEFIFRVHSTYLLVGDWKSLKISEARDWVFIFWSQELLSMPLQKLANIRQLCIFSVPEKKIGIKNKFKQI